MAELIMAVDKVCTVIEKSNPPILKITATGLVNCSGWSGGTLVPYRYIVFPEDGIQDFSFEADRPDGVAAQVISPIEAAELAWQMYNGVLKGVRVHSEQNKVEVRL